MARIVKNPFGVLSGKVGELVFKKGKYGPYVSSRPSKGKCKPSKAQLQQQQKMVPIVQFLKPLKDLIKECYVPFKIKQAGFNAAKSYFLKHAVELEDDHFVINYTKALVSFGDLRPIANLQMTPDAANHSINLQWTNNSQQAMAYDDDQLLVVYYAPDINVMGYELQVATRADEQATVVLGDVWAQTPVQVWTGFHRPEDQQASMSTYGGVFMV